MKINQSPSELLGGAGGVGNGTTTNRRNAKGRRKNTACCTMTDEKRNAVITAEDGRARLISGLIGYARPKSTDPPPDQIDTII